MPDSTAPNSNQFLTSGEKRATSARQDGSVLKLVLMGTGPFAVPSFDALADAGHICKVVFTRPERPGPGNKPADKSPVRTWAENRGFDVVAPESVNSPESFQILEEAGADLLVVCDYGQILKRETLGMAKLGGINLHGSLLPAHRGAAPVQWSVLKGDPESGVSVIHMTPRLDAGPVISIRRTPIGPKETAGQLEARLAALGVEATLEAVELLTGSANQSDSGDLDLRGIPQDDSRSSRAPRLSKSDGRIDWNRPAIEIDWHIRGMQPWPGAFSEVTGNPKGTEIRIAIMEVDFALGSQLPGQLQNTSAEPGTARICDGQLWVACRSDWVRIVRVKPSGKREMDAAEWLRGRPFNDESILR